MEDNEIWASRIISELFDEQLPDSWDTGSPLTNTNNFNDTKGNDTSPYVNSTISAHSDFESFQFSRSDEVNCDSIQNILSDYVEDTHFQAKITNYSRQEDSSYKTNSAFSPLTMDEKVNSCDPLLNCCRNMNDNCDQECNSQHTPTNNHYQSCENHNIRENDDDIAFLNGKHSNISEEDFYFESCRSSPASKASTAEKTNKEDPIRWKIDPVDTNINIQNPEKYDSFKNVRIQKTPSDFLDLHETRNEENISVDVEETIHNKENISGDVINVIKHNAFEDKNSVSVAGSSLMYSRIVSSTSQSPNILSVCAGDFEMSKSINTYNQSSLSLTARRCTESVCKRGEYDNDCQLLEISDGPISLSHEFELKLEDEYMDESKQFIVYAYRKMAKAIEICFISPLSLHIMGTIELLEFIVVLIICIFYELLCKFFIHDAYKVKTKIAHRCLKNNERFSDDTENANGQRNQKQISISGIISAVPCESLISFSSEGSIEQEHTSSTVETCNTFAEESSLSNSENESETPTCFINDSGDQSNKLLTNENWENEKYMPMSSNINENKSSVEDVKERKHLTLISLTEISSSFLNTSINHNEEQDLCEDVPLIKSPEYLPEEISLNTQISNDGSHWEVVPDLEDTSSFNESNSMEISVSKSSGNIILSDDEKESEMSDKWDAFNILFKHDVYPVSDTYKRNFRYDDNEIYNIQNNSSLDVNCSIDSETKYDISVLETLECFHPKSEWTEEESSFNLISKNIALKEQIHSVQSSPNLKNSITYSSKTCRSQSMPLLESAWKDDELANVDDTLCVVEMIAENREFNNINVKEYSDAWPSNLGDSYSFPLSNDQVDINEFQEVDKNIQVGVTGDILPGVSSEPFDVQTNTSQSESEDLKSPAQDKPKKPKRRKSIISQISAAFQGFKMFHIASSTERRKKYKKHFDEHND